MNGAVARSQIATDGGDFEVHLVHQGSARTSSYLTRQLSTKDARQSTKGYPTMIDLSVEVRVIRNRMVTQGAETAI